MKTLLIIGSFKALFLILLIISKRERWISDHFLGFFFSLALSTGLTWLEPFNANNGNSFRWSLHVDRAKVKRDFSFSDTRYVCQRN